MFHHEAELLPIAPGSGPPGPGGAGQYCNARELTHPFPPRHQRGIAVSIADRYRHCGTGPACSVFVPRRILDIKYYVFISDPGNFHVCMSVDAIPVLAPCGDRLKKGRRGAKERGPGDTKGALSYRGAFNKPECGQAQALEFCLSGQVGSASASAGQPSFSRPRSSSRSGERSLLFFIFFIFR